MEFTRICFSLHFVNLDVDECVGDPYPCDATNGGCTDSDGSYTCTCNSGYVLNADMSTCDGML